jgi:hypothetical protein
VRDDIVDKSPTKEESLQSRQRLQDPIDPFQDSIAMKLDQVRKQRQCFMEEIKCLYQRKAIVVAIQMKRVQAGVLSDKEPEVLVRKPVTPLLSRRPSRGFSWLNGSLQQR